MFCENVDTSYKKRIINNNNVHRSNYTGCTLCFLFTKHICFNRLICLWIKLHSLGLIYQSNGETSADLSAQINLRQSSHVIYETFVCRQSHLMKDHTLINGADEYNRHLNITPLETPRFRSLAPRVYDTEKQKPGKKEEAISWKRN